MGARGLGPGSSSIAYYCVSNRLTYSDLGFFLCKMEVVMWTATRPPRGAMNMLLKILKAQLQTEQPQDRCVCVSGWGGVLGPGGLCSEADVPLSGVPD